MKKTTHAFLQTKTFDQMKFYNFLFSNDTKHPFLRKFTQSALVVLFCFSIASAPYLVFENAKMKRTIIEMETQIESDSIFKHAIFKDPETQIDTLLPVTKQAIFDVIVKHERKMPAIDDLIVFSNWVLPVLNNYVENSKPTDADGVLIGKWEDWLEDQKALAAERNKQALQPGG